jgi:hypothetical protein
MSAGGFAYCLLMPSLLQRLYRTKLALIATLFTGSGIVLLGAASWHDWGRIPVVDIGSALLTTGLLALVFEYFDAQDADERLGAVIEAKAPVLRDAVLEGFATSPERMRSLASPDVIDLVIRNSIAAQLRDPQLAADLYTNLAWQIGEVTKPPQYDAHVTVSLTPTSHGPTDGFGSLFEVTTRWQYRTPKPPAVMRFSAVSDHDTYRRLVADPASVETWLTEPPTRPVQDEHDPFELLQCVINGVPHPIQRHTDETGVSFTVTPSYPTSGDVDVSYTHRTYAPQLSHLLFIDVGTTKGLRLDFTHSPACGISHVNVLPYIASPTQPRVERSPAGVPNPTISLDFGDAWTFPRSGAAFTWTLHREITPRVR